MKAIEYLQQLQGIETKLLNKLAEIEEYDYLAERLQTTSEPPTYTEAVDTYCQYIEKQQEIIKTLEGLSFYNYIVLYKHYYEHKLLQDACKELGKSRSWICKQHTAALKELQAVLDERESKA